MAKRLTIGIQVQVSVSTKDKSRYKTVAAFIVNALSIYFKRKLDITFLPILLGIWYS